MKNTLTLLVVCVAVGFSACSGGSTAVGTGDPISTLTTEPTGVELWESLAGGISAAQAARVRLPRPLSALISVSNDSSLNCPGGGTISVHSVTESSAPGSGTLSATATFEDCVVTMTLDAVSYEETLNGTEVVRWTVVNNSGTFSNNIGLTIAGDLGLALECNLSASGGQNSVQASGACTFRDSEGAEISATAAELAVSPEWLVLVADPFDF